MNWYKFSTYYDYLRKYPVTTENIRQLVEEGELPEGYYFVKNSGTWSVYSPEGTLVSMNYPS